MGSMKDLLGDTPYAYPESPGFKRHGTSSESASKMRSRAPTIRDRVLGLIKEAGTIGLSADETAECLGLSVLTVRPRLSELVAMGLIFENGTRSMNKSGHSANRYSSTSDG